MHRYASLFVLAGLMSATLHAQTPASAPVPSPPTVARPAQPPAAAPLPATAPPAAGWAQARPVQTPPAPPTAVPAAAQTAPPSSRTPPPTLPRPGSAAATTPPSPAARADSSASQNVRVDLTITDIPAQRTSDGASGVKVVTMLVADRNQGRIRSSNDVPYTINGATAYRQILINVDAIPFIRLDGRIQLSLTIEYTPDLPQGAAASPRPSSINESLTVLVADGKPTLISQSADPGTARKVSVEVTATIVK